MFTSRHILTQWVVPICFIYKYRTSLIVYRLSIIVKKCPRLDQSDFILQNTTYLITYISFTSSSPLNYF